MGRNRAYEPTETNPITHVADSMADYLSTVDRRRHPHGVPLSHPDLTTIDRLRLIGYNRYEYPAWDLSYCYGFLRDGTKVAVQLDRIQFSKNYNSELVELCKKAGKFGKSLGIFDAVSKLYG